MEAVMKSYNFAEMADRGVEPKIFYGRRLSLAEGLPSRSLSFLRLPEMMT